MAGIFQASLLFRNEAFQFMALCNSCPAANRGGSSQKLKRQFIDERPIHFHCVIYKISGENKRRFI